LLKTVAIFLGLCYHTNMKPAVNFLIDILLCFRASPFDTSEGFALAFFLVDYVICPRTCFGTIKHYLNRSSYL